MIALIVAIFTLIVLFSGIPIAFGLSFVSITLLIAFEGFQMLDVFAETFYAGLNSFVLLSIPMFILMGMAVANSPAGKDLYTGLDRWLWRVPGGLVISNIGACSIFAALSGSSPATCAAIGTMGIPEMRKRGYSDQIATGTIAAGGTLGVLIPPSIVLIVYGMATGTSIGKPVIRGLSGNRVLVYSQGVRVENQQFGDEHGLGLNDAGVESVEIIKGPASLLYGSDALGGVLYFNPEKFAKSNAFEGDFSQKIFSNTLGSNSSLGVKTSSENWKYLVRGSNNIHSDYKIADGNRVTNTRFNETDLKTGIGYSNSILSTVLRYNYNKLDLGIPENGIAEQSSSYATEYPKQAVTNHLLSLNSTLFFSTSKLDIDFGFISNNRSEFEDSDVANLKMKLNTLNYNLKYHLPKAGKLESIFGIQGMAQTNVNSGMEYLNPNAKTNDFGLFGTSNYEWN